MLSPTPWLPTVRELHSDTESFTAFANASLFYTLATSVHVYELQTANWPVGGTCNGGKTTENRGGGGGGGGGVTASRA